MKKLLLLLFSISLSLICLSQNTSPLIVKDFMLQTNGIMDIEQVPRDARTDWDSNPVCMIQVKAVGFDENLMQKFIFVPNGMDIMYKTIKNGMVILYVSSNKMGEITIKHMGDCLFKLPYKLEGHKIYILTLGMETATLVIRTIPTEAEIYIDNQKVGTGEAISAVSIGAEHRYRIVCKDYYTKEDVVVFNQREEKSVNVELEPIFGYITIKSEPSGADVYIDEVKVGVTPYQMKKVKLGNRVVELRMTGYESFADMVNIKTGEVNKQLEKVKLVKDPNYVAPPVAVNTATPATQSSQSTQIAQSTPMTPTASSASGNRTFTVNGVTFEMVYVKGGTFTMGCTNEQGGDCYDDEKPTHSVTLSDYYIGKFEVTQELWQTVMGNEPTYNGGWTNEYGWGNNYPAYRVSWDDVQEFITKLNQKTGANFRLPTEAEWEYAARGGNKSRGYKYSGSNNIGDVAWYTDKSGSKTHQVGTKSPNELGIYDMSGNVWEWCQDWKGSYSSGSQTNPTGPSSGSGRVLRGGGWNRGARDCRVSNRNYNTPDFRSHILGFRLAIVP